MRSKNYFIRLFYTNRFLFVLVTIFCAINLLANFVFKAEHTPIYLWNLYAYKIPEQSSYTFLEVKYNDGKMLTFPNTFMEPEKLFFTNTLNQFIYMKRNGGNDPLEFYINNWNTNHPLFTKMLPGLKFYPGIEELNKYPAWFTKYLQQYIREPVNKIDIYEVKVAYEDNGHVKQLSSTLIYTLL